MGPPGKRKLLSCLAIFVCAFLAVSCGRSARTYVQRGDKAYAASHYEEASLNYRHAVQKEPDNGDAVYGLALSELQLLKTRDAYELMSRAVKLLPHRDDVKVKYAEVCLMLYLSDAKRPAVLYSQLTETSDQLLAKDRNSFDGVRIKGYLAQSEHRDADAVSIFRRANTLKPMQPDIVLALTQGLVRSNERDEAERLCRQLIQAHKSFGPIYDVLYRLYLDERRTQDAEKVLLAKVDNNPKIPGYVAELAGHYAAFHKPAEMDAALRKLRDHPKDFPDAHLLIADFYTGLGDLEQARRELEQGAAENPKSKDAYLKKLTNVLLVQGKRGEASRVADRLASAYPKDTVSQTIQAVLLLNSGKPEMIGSAVAGLKEAVGKNPQNPAGHYSLGRAFLAQGDLKNARLQFQETLKRNPKYIPALLHLAQIAIQTQQFDEAIHQSQAVLALQPGNPRARLFEVEAQIGLGRMQQARDDLARLIRDQPQFVDAQLQLGLFEIHNKRYTQAEEIFRKLYKPGKADTRVLSGLAQIRIEQGRTEEALQLLEDEVKKSPDSVSLRSYLASTAAEMGKADAAMTHYKQLALNHPDEPEFQIKIGQLCFKQGQMDCAVASLQNALTLAPKSFAIAALLASTLEAAGKRQDAVAHYRDALQLKPDDPLVLNNLACLLADLGVNLDEAEALAERAQKQATNNPVVNDTVGWVYLKRGRRESALQIFGNLAHKYPDNPTFRYHYGAALLETGNRRQGRTELETALLKQPSKADQLRIQELLAKAQ